MAGNDPQKQLFSLIRDYAAERSQGERRISELKAKIEGLRSETIAANLELEEAKRSKETVEQELKGYEVELAMSEASIQALEVRIDEIQSEISDEGLGLESLKKEEGDCRDDFISKMFELNATIRKFHESVEWALTNENDKGTDSIKVTCENDAELCQKELEDKLERIISQTSFEEKEYHTVLHGHKMVQQELADLETRASLMERIMNVNMELLELSKLTSEWEEKCASFANELQKRFTCPSCHADNSDAASDLLQTSD